MYINSNSDANLSKTYPGAQESLRLNPQASGPNTTDPVTDIVAQVRADIDRFVESVDFSVVSERLENFGRNNPIFLGITALGLGLATGFLMESGRKTQCAEERQVAPG